MAAKSYTQRTIAKIETGNLSAGDILGMRRKLKNAMNGRDNGTDADAIVTAIETHRPFVDNAHAQAGIAALRAMAWTPKGTRRNTEKSREFTDGDLCVLADVTGFRMIGMHPMEYARHVSHVVPIYRCVGASGSFDYVLIPWQSGGAFWIERHA